MDYNCYSTGSAELSPLTSLRQHPHFLQGHLGIGNQVRQQKAFIFPLKRLNNLSVTIKKLLWGLSRYGDISPPLIPFCAFLLSIFTLLDQSVHLYSVLSLSITISTAVFLILYFVSDSYVVSRNPTVQNHFSQILSFLNFLKVPKAIKKIKQLNS